MSFRVRHLIRALIFTAIACGLVALAQPSEAQAEGFYDPDGEYCTIINPSDYYCRFNYWAAESGIHVKRVTISDDGLFGFERNQVSALPMGHGTWDPMPPYSYFPGSSNGAVSLIWDMSIFEIRANVDGLDVTLELFGGCSQTECTYVLDTIQLGDGWILDNGIDFSGERFTFTPGIASPDEYLYFEGFGRQSPYTPWDPMLWEEEADPQFSIASFRASGSGALQNQGTHHIDDYFGIQIQVEMDTDNIPLYAPEPTSGALISFGVLGLASLSGRRLRGRS